MQSGYSQRNSGTGDNDRLVKDRGTKVVEPTVTRNPTTQNPTIQTPHTQTQPMRTPPVPPPVTRPTHDYTPIRTPVPVNPIVPARSPDVLINPPVIYSPPTFSDQPDLPPPYDPGPTTPIDITPAANPDPYSNIDYKTMGKEQFNNEDYFGAVESFQLALARDTSDYLLYYQLGITQIELSRYVDAIHNLSKFIRSVSYNGLEYYERGLAKFYLGKKDKALVDFLKADQLNVEDVKIILKRFYDYY